MDEGKPYYRFEGQFFKKPGKDAQYKIEDRFFDVFISANADGFLHLAQQFLEMAKTAHPEGEDVWLPMTFGPFQMGEVMLILHKVPFDASDV